MPKPYKDQIDGATGADLKLPCPNCGTKVGRGPYRRFRLKQDSIHHDKGAVISTSPDEECPTCKAILRYQVPMISVGYPWKWSIARPAKVAVESDAEVWLAENALPEETS